MPQKSTMTSRCVVFAGGGTGGHLFPGIAVARELVRRYPGMHVVFAGTGQGMETRIVPREGFVFEPIRSAGLMGKSALEIARALFLVPVTLVDTARVIRRHRPDLVIGLGGYSAGPVVLMAACHGTPTMLMEQNAMPGVTNRLLARVVRAAAVSYDVTCPYFGSKAVVSGNPVREGFFAERPESPAVPRRVLVIGGSQGAHIINVAMVEAAPILARESPAIRVTHQTGIRDVNFVRTGYLAAGLEARVHPFLDAMDEEMRAADVVVCRAGATTLAEVSAVGLPAIVVPLPHATNDHQRRNAMLLADAGAAEVVDQSGLGGRELAVRLMALVGNADRRRAMSVAVRQLARPDASRIVVDRAENLIGLVANAG